MRQKRKSLVIASNARTRYRKDNEKMIFAQTGILV
jgi:hypothetical protein